MNEPTPPDPDLKSILAALVDAFSKLPPLLGYGGLILIAAIVLAWLTGTIPDILLAIPVVALVAFLVYAYLNNRHELNKEKLLAQRAADEREAEIRRLEMELERLKIQQTGDLEKERLKQHTSLERAKLKAAPTSAPATPPPPEPPSTASWPDSYLRDVWQRCAQLQMTSIDPKAQELGTAVLNLHSVFTALDVPAALEPERKGLQRVIASLREFREAERHGREPALAALSRRENERLVLLGQPGSGKSTLVKYLALCLSGAGLEASGGARAPEAETNLESLMEKGWRLPALLPVLVVLRDYAAKGLPQTQSLWDYVWANLKSGGLAACTQALHEHLKKSGGILLLDGLDEVPEAHERREQLREAIAEFERDFPKVRILVTSRPYAYQNPEWQLPGFNQTTLLDFTPEQIENYIDRWYAVAAPLDPNLDEERATQYASQLKQQVKYNPNLQELAPRPLLLALMVSLHRWRGGGLLPERREQLYDASVNLLLDLWQRPKLLLDERGQVRQEEKNALTELGIDAVALRGALSRLAFEVHHDQPEATGTADIPHEKLVATLRQAMPREKRDQIPYEKIAGYVRDRAGLLEDRGEDVYGFPHRTFQEYLAAMHLLDQEDFPENIVPLVRNEPIRWREATLLAGNSANTTLQWALVEQLYQRQDAPHDEEVADEAQWWGAFLAGQVLHDSELLKKETKVYAHSRDQVHEWHKVIVSRGVLPPRDRAQAGDVLAELGDDRPGVLTCDDMPLCIVPPGEFWMGDEQKNTKGHWNKSLDKPYWLAQYPVTVAQFREFVQESGYEPSRGSRPLADSANRPVVYVNWYDALAFCEWLNQRWRSHLPTGYRVILPSEAEWEKAARGGRVIPGTVQATTVRELKEILETPLATIPNPAGQREHPWGDAPVQEEIAPDQFVYRANGGSGGAGRPTAVGSFPAGTSPVGCLDMSGNVWEWTRSLWGKDYAKDSYSYPYYPAERENLKAGRDILRVLRGGAYYVNEPGCSARFRVSPHDGFYVGYGFRVAVSPFVSEL